MRQNAHIRTFPGAAAPDINTGNHWLLTLNELFSFRCIVLKCAGTAFQPKSEQRLGEKMLLVRRVRGVGVSPCGWNVSPGWTCHCCFCRPSVEIPFQLSHHEDFREEKLLILGELLGFFFVRGQWRYKTRNICLETWPENPPTRLGRCNRKTRRFPF